MSFRRAAPLIVWGITFLQILVLAQSSKLDIQFQMDGKPQKAPSDIEIVFPDGHILNRPIENGKFQAPDDLKVPVTVRIKFKGRTLEFPSVYPAKFAPGRWVVEIDRPPFELENDPGRKEKAKVKELWIIKFESFTGDGTVMVVSVRNVKDSSTE